MDHALNHWLVFDAHESDDGVLTLEAMASVAPRDLPQAWSAVQAALGHVHRIAASPPHPLERGGEWDMLLQLQSDDRPPITVPWEAAAPGAAAPAVCEHVRWVALTLTLVARESLASEVQERLQGD